MYPESTRRIAKVISNLLHPYICLPVVVALIAEGESKHMKNRSLSSLQVEGY